MGGRRDAAIVEDLRIRRIVKNADCAEHKERGALRRAMEAMELDSETDKGNKGKHQSGNAPSSWEQEAKGDAKKTINI